MMSNIHKHSINVTEALVICTICLGEYGHTITPFFVCIQASILFYFALISTVTIIFYKFKHLRETIK